MRCQLLANLVRESSYDSPNWIISILRLEREIKTDYWLRLTGCSLPPIRFDQLECLLTTANLFRDPIHLIIKHVAKTLCEDEWQNVVLIFRRILRPANTARCIPNPLFE